ncbi:MAG: DNA photolyase family protein [Anaerolineae bacterium]|jgi:deoxyribodipyrimidine photo-lyase|nr:DNA photolyase family protein [Anaerolineae bacterium]
MTQLVWFKRDLRIHDHTPLFEAAARGPVLPLYIVEPNLLQSASMHPAHWTFIRASLIELRDHLARLGQPLIVRVGEAITVFKALQEAIAFTHLWAYEESGNGLTYARDRAVRRWARSVGLPFTEIPQNGIIRGRLDRDQWSSHWEAAMNAAITPTPDVLPTIDLPIGAIPTHAELQLAPDEMSKAQPGGEAAGLRLLRSFLHERGETYTRAMSSPLEGWWTCSRLSPYLAWGTLSARRAYQDTLGAQAALAALPQAALGRWPSAYRSFTERLAWRSHFMQKLETEPRLEFENLVTTYDRVRVGEFNVGRFNAWEHGQTGYPMIDACMRCLAQTGWINFRMRAMLVSFAAYDLWLHWRDFAHVLSQRFLDYEPGIHYPQLQMQSGTTGINALRIYNPTKQAIDQDPNGDFIRKFVPELASVPTTWIHTPWLMPSDLQRRLGVRIGREYPAPIVDHDRQYTLAREKLGVIRQLPETRLQANAVQERLGSRRKPRRAPRSRKSSISQDQLPLF